ncbi:tetratricopeptide repeat protein [Flavobacterium adhaerens]|uniref:tetratricopeptide repeat protein n=1 Tax=Flavobacterium adhaerens TaxID=3149043 RepID=UPI0032B6094D
MDKILKLVVIVCVLFFSCKKTEEPKEKSMTVKANYGCAPETTDAKWFESDNKAPLFKGMDIINYPISTKKAEAQKYFNQGLAFAFGFNHAEAARSFYYATKLDSLAPMCFWGYAYVLGPNYNAGMEIDNYERAYKAIQQALKLSANATIKEKTLIEALSKRYVAKPVEDRKPLDIAYAKAMESVAKKFPNDATIGTLYAESLMNLHPWDLYTKEGIAQPWTAEIESILKNALKNDPKHIGANHFYIHAVESSNSPERANVSAQLFDNGLAPASGHLTHMSSHIYIRTGEYHKGTVSNINAVKRDSTYVTLCHAQGAYPLGYYPHNYHFMAACATLEGSYKYAILAANETSNLVHPQTMVSSGWEGLQHYYVIPYFVAVKFGKWDDILKMKLVSDTIKYPSGIAHYAKGMAYLGKNDSKNAKAELAKLELIGYDPYMKKITVWNINSLDHILKIASKTLKGEILASEGKFDQSIVLMKEAIAIEDKLNYNEPPDWFFSVRHHLGAIQIEAGKYEDAIKTYQEDLKTFPKNGWAQQGMKLAYEKLNNQAKVKETDASIAKSWAYADVKITASRIK